VPGQTSFYYAIFKKLQAVARSLNVHVNPDSDPSGNYGGFSLESPENIHGIFHGLGAQATEAGRMPGDKPLAGGTNPMNVPLYRILAAALPPTSTSLPDTVDVNGQVWWTMPYPLQGSLAGCPFWQEVNASPTNDKLVKAVGDWISAGTPNDSPPAPFDFASLKQPPVPKFPFKPGNKPGESSPILFVASFPTDDGRRPGDGSMPNPPAIPANFWDTSLIAMTNEAGVPQPDDAVLQAGTERYVRAVIGNSGNNGAGRFFSGQPHIQVTAFAQVFNTFTGPGVALPSLGNIDPADPEVKYEQYRLQILERDVVGFRFNVDNVYAGLKAAMAGYSQAQLGGTLDNWLKVGHACVKVLITQGELVNNYTPQGAVPTVWSHPTKDRHIAQHNIGQFDANVMGAKKAQWQNFIMAQAGKGLNTLTFQAHGLPAGAANLYLAIPTQTFERWIAKGGSHRGFEQIAGPAAKPFPDAVILHATGAEARLVAADHAKEEYLALSIGMDGDPAKLKAARPGSNVTVTHADHSGAVVGGFTMRLSTGTRRS
jgi:hypothetical protein